MKKEGKILKVTTDGDYQTGMVSNLTDSPPDEYSFFHEGKDLNIGDSVEEYYVQNTPDGEIAYI